MNKKSNVSWVAPAEPAFLKKFKSDVGFKEGPTVDTKRLEMPTLDDDSGSDRDDELPQVVVLKKGDLSADEVQKIKGGEKSTEKEDEPPADGKIVFKKPSKRSSDKYKGITASSSKKKKTDDGDEEKTEKSNGDGEKKEKSNGDGEKKEKSNGDGEKKEKSNGDGEKKEKSGKKVQKNNSLLSFGGDDDEEED